MFADSLAPSSTGGLLDQLSVTTPQGAAIKLGGEALGAILGKPISSSATSGGTLDSSGWNIVFGDGDITSTAKKADPANWLMIGGALIALALVVRAWKRG